MVKIRLRRVGAKKQPSYRVIVADSRVKRDGRFLEIIGHYNPRTDPPTVVIKEDRALYWLSVGAQPTEAVAGFFVKMSLPDKLKQVHAGSKIEDLAPSSKPVKAKAAKPVAAAPAVLPAEPKVVVVEAPVAEAPVVAESAAPEPVVTEPAVAETAAPEPTVAEPVVAELAAPEPVAAEPAVASELEVLGLSARVLKALEAADVRSLDQLRALRDQGHDAVLALPGIGEKAADEILAQLAAHEGTGS
jgi:small subunit ribosomal protein S16